MTNSFPAVSSSPLGYGGLDPKVNPPFINANRAPTSLDLQDAGTQWLDNSASPKNLYESFGNGVWNLSAVTSSSLNTLTASSGGALTPVANNINIVGTASQITTAGAGATITLSLPNSITVPGSLTTTTTLAVGTNLSVGGTSQFTGAVEFLGLIDFDGGLEVVGGITTDTLDTTGNVTMSGAASVITIGDAAQTGTITLGSSTAANSVLIQDGVNAGTQITSIANGATAADSTVNILSGAGSAGVGKLLMADNPRVTQIDMGNVAPAATRVTTIAGGNSAVNDTVTIFGGAPSANTQTFNLFSGNASGGTQVVNIGTGTNALALNLGTGGTGVKTIAIGGTAANVITIGNAQTAGSIAMGTAMTTGTISIGGTGLHVGAINIAPGTGAQTVNIAAGGTGIKTLHIADDQTVANVVSIGSLLGTSTFNGPTLVTLASGAGTGLAVSTAGGTGIGATITSSAATVDALRLAGGGLKVAPVDVAAAGTPQTANGRFFKVTFSGVSIASGASQAFVISNSMVTGVNTDVMLTWYGATAGSGLSMQSVVMGASSITITMTNATSATMVTSVANITFVGWVLN